MLRVTGTCDLEDMEHIARRIQLHVNLAARLGVASGVQPPIEAQAALFNGVVHAKQDKDKVTMSVLLHDAQHFTLGHEALPPASQLWVR
jgi:hypothetical protein